MYLVYMTHTNKEVHWYMYRLTNDKGCDGQCNEHIIESKSGFVGNCVHLFCSIHNCVHVSFRIILYTWTVEYMCTR